MESRLTKSILKLSAKKRAVLLMNHIASMDTEGNSSLLSREDVYTLNGTFDTEHKVKAYERVQKHYSDLKRFALIFRKYL